MEISSAFGLIAVVVLVLANGFFVATEFAIVAVRRSRLEELAAEGRPSARAAKDVVGHLDTSIAACQLGITMASLALGWMGEPAFAHLVEPPLELLVGQLAPALAHGIAIGVSFALITGLHIVLGEQVPKLIGLQRPEGTTLFVARPMQLFLLLFRWPVAALNNVGNGVLRLLGLEPGTGHEMVHSIEELRLLVNASQQAGTVEATEARIASRAFEFGDLTAGALMTPRTELDAVPLTITFDELLDRAAASTHNRLLVYRESLDEVVGVLHVRDLLTAIRQPREAFKLESLLRPVLMVPETKAADDLLDEMRETRRQLALVIDEYGGTAGIVTLENLVEALVGRIEEEPPIGDDADAIPSIAVESDGSMLLEGLTRLDEFEELTQIRIDDDIHEEVETLGGLVMANLDRIPEVGDEVVVDGRRLRVEQLDGRRVELVRLLPPEPPAADGTDSPGPDGPDGTSARQGTAVS